MKVFTFKWFDGCKWAHMRGSVVADNEETAAQFIRDNASVDSVPYTGGKTCSLELVDTEAVAIPGWIVEPREDTW